MTLSHLLPIRWGAGMLLGLGLLCSSLVSLPAQAAISGCRSDPAVTLSNGVQILLYEDISDTATDVTKITYTLHVPVGVTVTSISYSGAVPSKLQSLTTVADENSGNYDGYTLVSTKTPNVPVAAYMSANGTVSAHTNGSSGELLHSHLHLP